MQRSNVLPLTHESSRLRNNWLGDPHLRDVPVYLPPGYDSARKNPYPVFFILEGWSGDGNALLHRSNVFTEGLPQFFDQAIVQKRMDPFVAVFPNCEVKWGSSQYVNSAATGPYMDYLCDELVPFVEKNAHVAKDPDHRGLLGHSSGGFGALATGMLRPDVFHFICSSAGDSWYENLYLSMIPTAIQSIDAAGGVEAFLRKFFESSNPLSLLPRDHGKTMMLLNMMACYTPNTSVPTLGADLFFDLHTGQLIPKTWEKFLAWDPVRMIDGHVSALRRLKFILLECASNDEYGMHLGHRQMAKKLKTFEIPHEIVEYPGSHSGHRYRFPQRIKALMDRMD